MRRIGAAFRECDEAGSSVIVFVMTLPLLLLFLCVLVDFGRVVFVQMAIDDAAQDACRLAADGITAGSSVSSAQVSAEKAVSEALRADSAALSMQVRADIGAIENVRYDRQRYSAQERGFVGTACSVDSRKIEVFVKAGIACLTPVGAACARLSGNDDGKFQVEARAANVAWIARKE